MIKSDRFSFRTKEAMRRAAEIVERYGHHQIDTEHLLLALIEQTGSSVPKLLGILLVDTNSLVDRLVFSLKASPRTGLTGSMTDKLNLTLRARQLFEQASFEADQLDDESVSPEHLLLATFYERDTPAALILEGSGLTRKRVLEALLQVRARLPGEDSLAWDE
jgi:ATP-dependent Clp protease ATP-binding subunit ClpC